MVHLNFLECSVVSIFVHSVYTVSTCLLINLVYLDLATLSLSKSCSCCFCSLSRRVADRSTGAMRRQFSIASRLLGSCQPVPSLVRSRPSSGFWPLSVFRSSSSVHIAILIHHSSLLFYLLNLLLHSNCFGTWGFVIQPNLPSPQLQSP